MQKSSIFTGHPPKTIFLFLFLFNLSLISKTTVQPIISNKTNFWIKTGQFDLSAGPLPPLRTRLSVKEVEEESIPEMARDFIFERPPSWGFFRVHKASSDILHLSKVSLMSFYRRIHLF